MTTDRKSVTRARYCIWYGMILYVLLMHTIALLINIMVHGHNLKKQTKKGTRAVCLEDSVVDRKLRLRFRMLDEPGTNPKKTSSAENPNQTRQVR